MDSSHGPWESTHSPVMTCDGIFTIDDGIVHPHSLGYNGIIIKSLQSMLLNESVHHVKILRAVFESIVLYFPLPRQKLATGVMY